MDVHYRGLSESIRKGSTDLDVLVKKAEPVACFFSVRDPASCLRGSIRRCRMFLAKGLHQVSEAQEDDINI
jgi:hypothetical protein